MAVITVNKTDKDNKKIFTINDFRGVDFSNSMVDVSPKRASYMLNMINDNGINRKRNGWNTTKLLTTSTNEDDGIAKVFVIPVGSYTKLLATITNDGHLVFVPTDSTYSIATSWGTTNHYLLASNKTDYACFLANDKTYIVGSGVFKIITFTVDTTNNRITPVFENSFVPTTTIGITQVGNRTSYDEINKLTKRRKNKLLGAGAQTCDIVFDFSDNTMPTSITFSFGGSVYAVSSGDTLTFPREAGTYTYSGSGNGKSTSGTVTISNTDIGTTKTIYPTFTPTVTPL